MTLSTPSVSSPRPDANSRSIHWLVPGLCALLLSCSSDKTVEQTPTVLSDAETINASPSSAEPPVEPGEPELPENIIDVDKLTDADWLTGAMARRDAREYLLKKLLRDDGYQGAAAVQQTLIQGARARLAKEPQDASTLVLLAMLQMPTDGLTDQDGELLAEAQQVISGLEAAIAADSRRVDAMVQLGEMYELFDDHKANAMWETAIEHYPHDLEIRNHLGEGYTKTGQAEQARTVALKTIELAAANGTEEQLRKARNIVGTALVQMEQYPEAEKYLKEALVNRDGSHWNCAYQALGVLYSKMGTAHDDPADDFEELTPDPNDAAANFSAALRYYYAHKTKGALSFIDRAITLKRTDHALVVRGFMLMSNKDYDGARAHFDEAAALAPSDPGSAIGRGHLAIVQQNYTEAQALLEPALQRWLESKVSESPNPDYYHFMHRMGCLGMGWLLANQDRHESAIHYFDRVLAHRPSDLLARLGKGNSLMGLHHMDRAESELQIVLDLDPDNPYAKSEMASIYLSRGEVERAEQGFQDALDTHKAGYTCPYEGLGMVYLKQGRIEKARTNFEKAISLNPDIEYKKYNGLARIYVKDGRIDEARKLLERSIANYPYDDEAKKLLEELKK